MKILSTIQEYSTIINGDKPVVIDFFAQWCPPCKMIGPRFEKMAAEHTDVHCVKIDVDENRAAAAEAGVSAMPTFMAFKGGKKIGEVVGANEAGIRQLIEKAKSA